MHELLNPITTPEDQEKSVNTDQDLQIFEEDVTGSEHYCQSLIDHDYQSSVSPDVSTSNFDCGAEGFAFVAGYYAYKFKAEFPELGQKTCDTPKYGFQTSTWINALSRGGSGSTIQIFFVSAQRV